MNSERQRHPAIQKSAVLRGLAVGVPLARIPERASKRTEGVSADEVRAVLADAAVLVRDGSLLLPAEAAFRAKSLLPPAGPLPGETPPVERSHSDFGRLRSLAEQLLRAYVESGGESSGFPDPEHIASHSAALQYAEALVLQQEVIDALGAAASDESSVHAALTKSDRSHIDELMLYWGVRGHAFTTLDGLIEAWHGFVGRVERTPGTSYDYEDFEVRLIDRDSLEDAISLLTPDGRGPLESRVRPLDERFLHVTRPVSSSIRPPLPWAPQRWWWYRVPSRLGEHFKHRLEHLAPAAAREALAAQDDMTQIQGETQR
jgi:hypothetical protein